MVAHLMLLSKVNLILNLYTKIKLGIKVRKALNEYNKYRVPEVKGELLSFSSGEVKVRFSGPFCRTCGFYDYFEDYGVILERFGVKVIISSFEEVENGAIVLFKVLDYL